MSRKQNYGTVEIDFHDTYAIIKTICTVFIALSQAKHVVVCLRGTRLSVGVLELLQYDFFLILNARRHVDGFSPINRANAFTNPLHPAPARFGRRYHKEDNM